VIIVALTIIGLLSLVNFAGLILLLKMIVELSEDTDKDIEALDSDIDRLYDHTLPMWTRAGREDGLDLGYRRRAEEES
jgi:hypothetical protein